MQQTEGNASAGMVGYHVVLTGDNGDEPAYYVRSGGTWSTIREAKREAASMLRAAVADTPSAWWTASIERGEWRVLERYQGIDLMTFDYDYRHDDRSIPSYWQLVDGKLVDAS